MAKHMIMILHARDTHTDGLDVSYVIPDGFELA